jgi:hypothetical protein
VDYWGAFTWIYGIAYECVVSGLGCELWMFWCYKWSGGLWGSVGAQRAFAGGGHGVDVSGSRGKAQREVGCLKVLHARSVGVFILLGLCMASAAWASGSELTWDRTQVSLEMGPKDTEARAVFRVTNTSEVAVTIGRVTSSCGCTASAMKQKVLKPGEATELTAIFEKGKRRGKNESIIKIYLKGGDEPIARLKLSVMIQAALSLRPEIVYWSGGRVGPRTVSIQLDLAYANTLAAIQFNPELLSVKQKAVEGSSGKFELIIEPRSYGVNLRERLMVKALDTSGAVVEEKQVLILVRP